MPKSKPAQKPKKAAPKSSREKVRAYRARMKAKGLKPVTLWLPDVHSEEFRREAHEEGLRLARSTYAKEDQDFVQSHANEILRDII